MKSKTTLLLFAALAIFAGCSPGGPTSEPAPTATAEVQAEPATAAEPETATEAVSSELAGTSWQMINISSMDDSVFEPADSSVYTLAFGADGRVAIQADCNRATGGWSSKGPGQLEFSVLAATRAMCRPESLSDKYLQQFQWVRSYVLREGHLFLATMADGAIIEFEPVAGDTSS